MRQIIILITTIFISVSASNSLLAQADTVAISKIKAFTKYIDSLSDNDEGQRYIIKSIAEGRITQEIVSTSIIGNGNKIDTTRKIKNAGFGKYTTENIKGDTAYRILYHDNIDKNFYESYYYKDNKLIYSKIDYQEDGIGQTFYFREEYYKDNEVLFVNESSNLIDTVYRQRVAFDLRKKGNDYLEKFQVDRRHSSQQKVLFNWGMTLKHSSTVQIPAVYPASLILLGFRTLIRLLVINLAFV